MVVPMKLIDYLKANNFSWDEFAKRIHIHPGYLYQIATGRAKPGLKTISKISKATRGQVTLNDLREDIL